MSTDDGMGLEFSDIDLEEPVELVEVEDSLATSPPEHWDPGAHDPADVLEGVVIVEDDD